MILEAIIISIIYIIFRQKNFKNLLKIEIDKPYLFLMGLGIVFILQYLTTHDYGEISYFLVDNYFIFHIISLIVIIISLIVNYKLIGTVIMAFGVFLNLLPIIANKKMPVEITKLSRIENSRIVDIIADGKSLSHGVFENPRFYILSDNIYFKSFFF